MVIGCGVPQYKPSDLAARRTEVAGIINGDNVKPDGSGALPWPWQVSIQVMSFKYTIIVFLLMDHYGGGPHSLYNDVLMKLFIFEPDIHWSALLWWFPDQQ